MKTFSFCILIMDSENSLFLPSKKQTQIINLRHFGCRGGSNKGQDPYASEASVWFIFGATLKFKRCIGQAAQKQPELE